MEDPLEEVPKEMGADRSTYTALRMRLQQQKVHFSCIRTEMTRVGSDTLAGGEKKVGILKW